jgi:precorrin-2 dehydrogenase / sirohydrochlorin ferrochelatase
MAELPRLYPVNLVLDGRPVLVVGGGKVALSKVVELVACGAVVTVVAPEIDPALRELDELTLLDRPYESGDVRGFRFVVSATGDPAVNSAVLADGDAEGIWVNGVDDPANAAVTLPARIRQGDLLVTFSTRGRAPAVARWLRTRFSEEFGPEYATLVDMVAAERDRLHAAGLTTEGLDWQGALDSGMLDLLREDRLAEAKERLQACLSSSSG